MRNRHQLLSDGKFNLEPIIQTDISLYQQVFKCTTTMQFVEGMYDDEDILNNFNLILTSSREIYFSVSLAGATQKFGFIGASVNKGHNSAEIGLLFLSKMFPKGAGKDSTILLINYLFEELGLDRIRFRISKLNKPALRGCYLIDTDFTGCSPQDNFQVGYIYKKSWKHKGKSKK